MTRKTKIKIILSIIIFIAGVAAMIYGAYWLITKHPIAFFISLAVLWWLSVCAEAYRAKKTGEDKKPDWSDCMNP